MISSEREEEAEHLPFFKPSSQSQAAPSSTFFLFGDTESRNDIARTTPQPFFQQEQQQESSGLQLDTIAETSSDRFNLIHTRLHKEADKIRNWKVQTEMDLKQRNKKLQDAHITIESQKKSILELQLQNENLSRKLQDELVNRLEISERIESTREMCNLLKDYTGKCQDNLNIFEIDRDELKSAEENHMKEYEDMEMKFKDLSLVHVNKINNLLLKLETEKNTNLSNNEQLVGHLAAVKKEQKDLKRQLTEKDSSIEQLNMKKQEVERQLEVLQQDNTSLQENLNEAVNKINSQAARLAQDAQVKEDLQKDKDTLTEEKVEVQQALQCQDKHKQELELKIESLMDNITELTTHKDKLTAQLQMLQENMAAKLGEIKILEDELKIALERENAANEEIESVKQEKQAERTQNEQLSSLLETAKDEQRTMEGQITLRTEEIQNLKTDLQTMQNVNEEEKVNLETALQNNTTLNDEIQELKDTHKEQYCTSIEELNTERNKIELLNKDLKTVNKQVTNLESKNKTLQGQLTTKTKQIKDQQQELKTLKADLKEQTRLATSTDAQVKSGNEEIEIAKTAMDEIRNELALVTEGLQQERSVIEDLNTKLNAKQHDFEDSAAKLQVLEEERASFCEKTAIALKEHNSAKQACDLQMIEVTATLNGYKADNDRIVAQKDKEIEQLQKDMDDQKDKLTLEKQQFQLKLQKMESQIIETKRERDEAQQQAKSLLEDTTTLENKLKLKDGEIHKVQIALEDSVGEPMTGISPIVPKRNAALLACSTPKQPTNCITPKSQRAAKPIAKTPSRSMLTQSGSVALRKRHVAFVSDEEDSADGSISGASSSSQYMEVEYAGQTEKRLATTNTRPSQTVQPMHVTRQRRTSDAASTPAKKTPISKPNLQHKQPSANSKSHLKPKKMRPQSDIPLDISEAELSRFRELYPDEDHNVLDPSSKVKANKPSSATNRIFKVKGQRDSLNKKGKKAGKTKQKVDLSWFDSDAVYGFCE